MNIADGFDEVRRAALRGAKPDPELKVDEWSERYMVLPKNSASPGPYRIERTPYARRVLQVLSPGHPCKRVVTRAASQMLKTQTAINWLLASIHQAPANILALEPNDTLAKRLSARFKKSIADIPEVRAAVAQPRSRDSRNTMDTMEFKGGALHVLTSGSAANLAEITVRYLYIDEVDRMAASVDGEGDPGEIAEARTTAYDSNCKINYTSSPTEKGFSKIDTLFEMGTQEAYHVPCPHCDHLHELVLENFHFQRDEATGFMDRAWFVCPNCGEEIEERHKGEMLKDVEMGGQARWVAASTGDGETISFTISAFYAKPGDISWMALARQYARALDRLQRGDPEAMRVFYNTRLALSFADTVHATSAQQLLDRARQETYQLRVVPDQALVLTMAVDTQPDRLEVSIEAWGPGLEHWVMDYQVLVGPPTDPPTRAGSVWMRLDLLRRSPMAHASGSVMYISAYAIDSGGHNTQDVYNYGAARQRMSCVVIKGASRPNKPIISSVPSKQDINWNGQKDEGGVQLWTIGTDTAKEWLYNRLKLNAGEGAMHMHELLGQHWFNGMVAERPKRTQSKTGKVLVQWIKDPNSRNEPWDLSVYNLAMAYKLGLHKWAAQDWARLRSKIVLTQLTPDLFAVPGEEPPLLAGPAPSTPPAPPAGLDAPDLVETAHGLVDTDTGEIVSRSGESVPPTGEIVPAAADDQASPSDESTDDGASVCIPDAAPAVPPAPAPVAQPAFVNAPLYPLFNPSGSRRRMRSRGI